MNIKIAKVAEFLASKNIALSGDSTCLYPSAGSDFKVLSLTHPHSLFTRGVHGFPEIGVYVVVDKNGFNLSGEHLGDCQTRMEISARFKGTVSGFPAELLVVQWYSNNQEDVYASRTLAMVLLETTNQASSIQFHREGWCADVFVGITDGCRFGGNSHCVNDLRRGGPANIKVPVWWITDHFVGATLPNPMAVGDRVVSDSDFPFVFEKAALLSSSWAIMAVAHCQGLLCLKCSSVRMLGPA